MREVILVFVLYVSFLSACMANEREIFSGLYMGYEEAEYENIFVECSSSGIWLIVENSVHGHLQTLYRSSELSKYGELLIRVKGRFAAIDKEEYPNSHYAGEIVISQILNHTNDLAMIHECRDGAACLRWTGSSQRAGRGRAGAD